MNVGLIWNNLVTYSLQIGLLVGLAAFVPAALRLRLPRARLVYWQILLGACLLLPLVRPWRQQFIIGDVQVSTTVMAIQPSGPTSISIPWTEIGLGVLAAGALCRLAWLALGCVRLQRYRRHSRRLPSQSRWTAGVEFRMSENVTSPVTFGLRNPVVLLPPQFSDLSPAVQEAILCHELLHIERRDWLITMGEEVVRAIFWFHPAIWWLLGEIHLAREQAVDREVIERTQAREEYLDALLAIAGARHHADLAPAPLFLRKRHLKQRVVGILKEVRMSNTRLLSALAAGFGILALACWFVTTTLPLTAAPQVVEDGAGVTVDLGGATLMHRTPVMYPAAARAKGVQGDVALELTLDNSGAVADARVVSGPEELRKSGLQAVLNGDWHFSREAGATRRVTISFRLPATAAATRSGAAPAASRPVPVQPSSMPQRKISNVRVLGLSEQMTRDLEGRLTVRAGDMMTDENMRKLTQVVKDFDEHLTISIANVRRTSEAADVAVNVTIQPPGTGIRGGIIGGVPGGVAGGVPGSIPAPPSPPESGDAPERIRVGGNVQAVKIVYQPRPTYPLEAKEARIQGVVKLSAVIAKDGAIKELTVISGHPLLVPSALDAVKQWRYDTTLLNGNPVEVVTQIDVNYTLAP